MNLKYLSFGHVEGFNELPDENKDEFISLYKEYVQSLNLQRRGQFSESKIKRIYVTRFGNYQMTFCNRKTLVTLKPKNEDPLHMEVICEH